MKHLNFLFGILTQRNNVLYICVTLESVKCSFVDRIFVIVCAFLWDRLDCKRYYTYFTGKKVRQQGFGVLYKATWPASQAWHSSPGLFLPSHCRPSPPEASAAGQEEEEAGHPGEVVNPLQIFRFIYSWFSLFMVVTFHKVGADTELVNTNPLSLGEIQRWKAQFHLVTDKK